MIRGVNPADPSLSLHKKTQAPRPGSAARKKRSNHAGEKTPLTSMETTPYDKR